MATRGGRSSDGFRDSQGGCGRPKRVRTRAIVGALVIGLVVGFLAPGAVATSYTDEFETNPLSAEVVTSFSTGTAATGLSYTCSSTGDGCDFTWGAGSGDGGSLCIDVLSGAETAATEKFTIVSRDGKAFVFNSVWMDVLLGDGVWIVGKGPEPFDIVVGTGSVGTYSPPGGSKLVTEVEFSSTHFAWDYIDTVSVELDVPGAGLEGNGTLIENGDTSASLSDDTDMGETPVGTPITKTFTIQSIGDLPLDLDGSPLVDISGDPDFTILSQPTLDPVPSGNSTTFTVQFNPSSSGENKTATVSIDNNSEAHPYTFAVEGTGTGAPEIDVEGNGTSIPDGDVTSELADHTNFGQVSIGSSFDRTFTIQNEGNATLTLTDHPSAVSLSGSSDFSVFTQPGIGSVAPSGSTTFVIRCAPTATGNQVAYVSIANSDADEDPYNFEISGTGLDTTKPEVTIKQAGGQADPTNGSPINFDVVFTEPVTGFATGDVTLSGAAGATTGTVTEVAPNDGTTYNVAVSGMTGDGTVTATIPAGVAQDAASNTNNASTTTDDTVTYDTTGPTVTIDQAGGQADPTNGSPINFTVVFSEAVTGFATGDVTLSGAAGATTATVTGGGMTYNVAVNGMTGDGTVIASIGAGVATDPLGNGSAASTTTDNSVSYDNTPPTDPTPRSSSHDVNVWDNDVSVIIEFLVPASDGGSGVDGFEIEWDQSGTWAPTPAKEKEETWSGDTFTATANGDWYFHIATVDNAGNWTSTVHLGPFRIDTALPSKPTGLSPADGSITNADPLRLEWDPCSDTGGSGMRSTATYRVQVDTVPVAKDYYTANTYYEPELDEGTYHWYLYSRDNAGNVSLDSATFTVTIDRTAPDVTIDQAGGQSDPTNGSPVEFTAVFDEPIDDGTFEDVDITFVGTATTGAVTITESGPLNGTTFSVSVVVTGDGTVIPTLPAGGVEDPAGNTNTLSTSTDNTVTYDGTPPDVSGLTENLNMIAEPDAGDQKFTLTVVYDEPMNIGVAPTVSFPTGGENPAATLTLDLASDWTNNTTYVARYDVANSDEEIDLVDVRVTGAQDLAGNVQPQYDEADVFSIDTVQPTVSSLTENLSMIAEANEGDQTFTLTVVYDEPMNIGVAPTVSFPVEDPTGTITLDTEPDGSGWSGSTTYVALYNVADADEEIDLIDVRVTGGKDAAGNTQVQYDETDVFSVDTKKPAVPAAVGSVMVNTNPVYEGNLTQQVTVTFTEAMDTSATPAIDFSHETTWTEDVGSRLWSALDTVFTVTYTLTDLDEEHYDRTPGVDVVTVDVTGAKDAAGNDQENYAPQAEFDIDTLQPTLIDATSSTPDGCYIAGEGINVTLTFSEDVRFDLPIGELELVLDVGGARAASDHLGIIFIHFLGLTDTASGTYTVAADENSCDLTLLSYSTTFPDNLVDWAGNVIDYQLPAPGSNIADHKQITVDTTLPVAIEDPNGDEDRSASDDTKTIDVRSDPYGRHRLTIRENTPAYIDVKFNDSDLPCTVQLGILDIPQPPENGSAWFDDPATNIRYAPDHDYLGPDSFTYRIYDACGNVSGEATVYVEVLPQIVMDDQYLTICQNESVKFDISAADLFVPEHDFTFSILAGPTHGVVVGDLADVTYTPHGPTTAELEFSTITLTYTPALAFVGFDNIRVAVAEPFGGRGVVEVDIIVGECEPGVGEVASIELGHGMVLPIIVPVTFEVVAETTPDALILMSREDGLVYPGALSILWSEEINRYVLLLDSGPLPLGAYWLMIPLGNGDRVELIIEVGEAE